jgi:hypothetical protein
MSEKTFLAALAILGFVITFGLSIVSETTLALNSGLFWGLGVPLMALAALVAGYLCPPRTWSYGCAITGGAWAARIGLAGGSLSVLLPPAILYAVAIAVICGGAAKLGNFLETRSASG